MTATLIPPYVLIGIDPAQRRVLRLLNEAFGQMQAHRGAFPRHTVQATATLVGAVLAEAKDDGSAKTLTDVHGAFIAHQTTINTASAKIEAEVYRRMEAESAA